jgi:roadblock/LC7 domain-containing protein
MADITLADYTGYIFLQIIKAREMADQYSKSVAVTYAADPVMKFFSVPRFKVPKMELTIPVLISGARFSQVVRFKLDAGQFSDFIVGQIEDFLELSKAEITRNKDQLLKTIRSDPKIRQMVQQFHAELLAGPMYADRIVSRLWNQLLGTVTEVLKLSLDKQLSEEAYFRTMKELMSAVTANIVVDSTTIESLLINPETNVVKNGSSDTSVFTIKAEMLEEGFFIRSVKDDAGQERQIVEFE